MTAQVLPDPLSIDLHGATVQVNIEYWNMHVCGVPTFFTEPVKIHFMRCADTQQVLADSIKERRKAAGLSQHDLAERAGIGFRTLQDIEGKKAWPGIESLERIAEALGCDVCSLFRPAAVSLAEKLDPEFVKDFLAADTEIQRAVVLLLKSPVVKRR